jgi:hypothetical protein
VVLGLGPGAPAEAGGGAFGRPAGPGDQQVVLLQPLSQTSLALVATLLSVSGEVSADATEATGAAALPNQPAPKGVVVGAPGGDGGEAVPGAVGSQPPPQTAAPPAPVARFVAGLDRALARAREGALRGSLFGESKAVGPAGRAVAALLKRLAPRAAAVARLGLNGAALSHAVEAVIRWLKAAADRHTTGQQGPVPEDAARVSGQRSALVVGTITIGFAALRRPVADVLRPVAPRTRGPSTGDRDDG